MPNWVNLPRLYKAISPSALGTRSSRTPQSVFFIIAAGLAFLHFREPTSNRHAYRLQLEPPEDGEFVAASTSIGGFSISPDGTTAVYVANVKGKTALWIHPLDGTPRMLPGTEDAGFPFWSPDGKSIAFFAGARLLRTTIAGGTPLVLCDVGSPRGGAWSEDGRIIFGTYGNGMLQVPESGGMPRALTTPGASSDDANYFWPQVVPGGRLLYWNVGGSLERGAYAASLARPDERGRTIGSDTNALFAPGGDGKDYFLLLRGAALLAQEVNRDSLQLTGAPRLVDNPVGSSGNTAYMRVAASANGVLIYQPSTLARFTWFDRAGKALGVVGEPGDYSTFRLSPDGRKLAASRLTPGGSDLWLLELDRGISTPFARGRGPHAYPIWSRDGSIIIFSGPTASLFRRLVQGTGQEMSLLPPAGLQLPYDWSRDGRFILYSEGQNVWILPVTPDGSPTPEAKPKVNMERRFNLTDVRLSPMQNPQWVAYYSNESGRYEVYIQAFPEPRGAVRVSTGGGRWPEWGPDGRELFYVSADNKLMSVSFRRGAALEPSVPHELFTLPTGDNQFSPYDVTSDGQRFLVRTPAERSNRSLTVIIDWPELLKRGAEAP
jgi:eukaryotic-like serine/threonine-protein kinase